MFVGGTIDGQAVAVPAPSGLVLALAGMVSLAPFALRGAARRYAGLNPPRALVADDATQGLVRRPMEDKNIWRLCKPYGRQIGYPMLKPHDPRHGVAMEVYEQHHDLEEVRGLLGHKSIETTQLYAQIRPAGLKHAVNFYEAKALDALSS